MNVWTLVGTIEKVENRTSKKGNRYQVAWVIPKATAKAGGGDWLDDEEGSGKVYPIPLALMEKHVPEGVTIRAGQEIKVTGHLEEYNGFPQPQVDTVQVREG